MKVEGGLVALSKAAGVIHTRALIRAKGEPVEKAFLAKLTADEAALYQKLIPVGKLPIETAVKRYECAALLIYPALSVTEGLKRLGYATALNDMGGTYKIFLRLATPEFVIRQSAKIWKTYHDAGSASIEPMGAKSVRFLLREYPDLPKNFLNVISGYTKDLLELVNVKNPKIQYDDSNPSCWSRTISWD